MKDWDKEFRKREKDIEDKLKRGKDFKIHPFVMFTLGGFTAITIIFGVDVIMRWLFS